MGLKPILFLLASLLVVTTRVSSKDEELLMEAKVPMPAPAHSTVKAPSPPPVPVKPPVLPPPPVGTPPKTTQDCISPCLERCKLHSRKRVCMRACMTCCDRCKCVPPGTYGNREKCGKCYTDMTTSGGRLKCP